MSETVEAKFVLVAIMPLKEFGATIHAVLKISILLLGKLVRR